MNYWIDTHLTTRKLNELESIDKSSLEITSGQFVVVVSNETSGAVKAASKSIGRILKNINDFVIVRQHQSQNDTLSIYKIDNLKKHLFFENCLKNSTSGKLNVNYV